MQWRIYCLLDLLGIYQKAQQTRFLITQSDFVKDITFDTDSE